jgi:hypothetical protein
MILYRKKIIIESSRGKFIYLVILNSWKVTSNNSSLQINVTKCSNYLKIHKNDINRFWTFIIFVFHSLLHLTLLIEYSRILTSQYIIPPFFYFIFSFYLFFKIQIQKREIKKQRKRENETKYESKIKIRAPHLHNCDDIFHGQKK